MFCCCLFFVFFAFLFLFCFYCLFWFWGVLFGCFLVLCFFFCFFGFNFIVCLGFCWSVCFLFFPFFLFFWPCHRMCRVLVPWLGVEPKLPCCECQVLATGPPGSSQPQGILIGLNSLGVPILAPRPGSTQQPASTSAGTPQAKQPARQGHIPTHQQTVCLKLN